MNSVQSAECRVQNPKKRAEEDVRELVSALAARVAELDAKVTALNGKSHGPRFSRDDNRFLAWVLGFTAGAHSGRDGAQNERIFAWCRQIDEKLAEQERGNGS